MITAESNPTLYANLLAITTPGLAFVFFNAFIYKVHIATDGNYFYEYMSNMTLADTRSFTKTKEARYTKLNS